MEGIMQMGPWRMLETGLRGRPGQKAIRYFRNSSLLTEEFIDKFAGYLRLHAKKTGRKRAVTKDCRATGAFWKTAGF